MKKTFFILLCLCSSTYFLAESKASQNMPIDSYVQKLILTNRIDTKDAQGETALFKLCSLNFFDELSWQRRLDLIALLLAHGANPNITTKSHKHTPLHLASRYCFIDIAKKLIEYDAHINALTIQNLTPLDLVGTYHLLDEDSPRIPLMKQLLIEHGGKKAADILISKNKHSTHNN